ncbi:Uncharacterised protein [uncultured archaeon]|nr:Uncharacterised protein [uncultured archaeon]
MLADRRGIGVVARRPIIGPAKKRQKIRTITINQFVEETRAQQNRDRKRLEESQIKPELKRMKAFAKEHGVLAPSGKGKKLKPMKFPKNVKTLSWKQFIAEEEEKKRANEAARERRLK